MKNGEGGRGQKLLSKFQPVSKYEALSVLIYRKNAYKFRVSKKVDLSS